MPAAKANKEATKALDFVMVKLAKREENFDRMTSRNGRKEPRAEQAQASATRPKAKLVFGGWAVKVEFLGLLSSSSMPPWANTEAVKSRRTGRRRFDFLNIKS